MFNQLNPIQAQRFFNASLVVVILLAAFLGVKAMGALKEYKHIGRGVIPTNIINVSGTGEVMAVPDTGSFSFSVTEEGKTAGEAQSKASTKINALIDAIKSLGVAEKDIKTVSYNSYPKYEYTRGVQIGAPCTPDYCPPSVPGKQTLVGYEVSQTISVKIRKTEDSGAILTKVGQLGATNISGIDFVIDDPDAVQAEARDKAIADAKAKAEVLAESLGVKLSRVVNFQESGAYPPVYYAMDAKVMNQAGSAAPMPEIPVGENRIVSNVTITYEIE